MLGGSFFGTILAMEIFTGVVLLDNQSRIYLIKEDDKNQIGQDRWNLPGGAVEADEGIVGAARRETLEETGYEAEMKSIVGCYKACKGGAVWIYIVLAGGVVNLEKTQPTDPDIKEGQWFEKEEFLEMDDSLLVHPDMKQVYQIALENRGLPLETVKFINYSAK